MIRRGVTVALVMALLSACGSSQGKAHSSPKPSPPAVLTPSMITSVVKNFWTVSQQAITQNDPGLLASVYAGPALDQAQTEMAVDAAKAKQDPVNNPLQKYPWPFVSATAVNASQPPEATWFAATVTYNRLNQDDVFQGQETVGLWIFVLVEPIASVLPSASANPSAAAGGPANATASPTVTPGGASAVGTWIAYLNYTNILESFGTSMTATNANLARAKESSYNYTASSLASDYASYMGLLVKGQEPASAPYATGATDPGNFSSTMVPQGGAFGRVTGVSFKAYPDQPLISYVDGTQDEVVLFAMQRATGYAPGPGLKCLPSINFGGNLSWLLPAVQYRSISVNETILVVAKIPPKSRPTNGGRLLVDLQGELQVASVSAVAC